MIYATGFKQSIRSYEKTVRNLRKPQRLVADRNDQELLRQHLLLELSRGERSAVDTIEALIHRLRAKPLPGAIMLVQVDTLANPVNGLDTVQRVRIREQTHGLIKSIILSYLPASIVGGENDGRLIAIASAGHRSPLSEEDLKQAAENICQATKAKYMETLTVGIGSISKDEQCLISSYLEARETLSYQLFFGNDRQIFWNQVVAFAASQRNKAHSDLFSIQAERKLRERIIAGDKKGAAQTLDMLLDSMRAQPHLTPIAFKSHLLQTLIVICRSAARIGADVREITDNNLNDAKTILETDSYPALRAYMHALVEDVIHATLGRGKTPKSDVVLLAKKYIAENYARSPSLREVANFVHLSPHYFSRIFAEENDCGFQDYLNKVRIEAAKDMLRNSPIKVKQAARRVGFKDVSHFARLFRRLEGMSPAEFTRSVGQVKS